MIGKAIAKGEDHARRVVREALVEAAGSTNDAARILRVSRPTMQRALRRLGMLGAPARIRALFAARYAGRAITG